MDSSCKARLARIAGHVAPMDMTGSGPDAGRLLSHKQTSKVHFGGSSGVDFEQSSMFACPIFSGLDWLRQQVSDFASATDKPSSYALMHDNVSRAPARWRRLEVVDGSTLEDVLYEKAEGEAIAKVWNVGRC